METLKYNVQFKGPVLASILHSLSVLQQDAEGLLYGQIDQNTIEIISHITLLEKHALQLEIKSPKGNLLKDLATCTQTPIVGWFSYRKFTDLNQLIMDLEKIKDDSAKNNDTYQSLKRLPAKQYQNQMLPTYFETYVAKNLSPYLQQSGVQVAINPLLFMLVTIKSKDHKSVQDTNLKIYRPAQDLITQNWLNKTDLTGFEDVQYRIQTLQQQNMKEFIKDKQLQNLFSNPKTQVTIPLKYNQILQGANGDMISQSMRQVQINMSQHLLDQIDQMEELKVSLLQSLNYQHNQTSLLKADVLSKIENLKILKECYYQASEQNRNR